MRIHVPLLLASLLGCTSTLQPRPDLFNDVREGYSNEDLAEVLRSNVSDAGRVDYAALHRRSEALDRQYARNAAIGPDTRPDLFPTESDRLAYWINAYNTAVLALVQDHYPIASVLDVRRPWIFFFLPRTSGFFYFHEVVVDGQEISLYALENDIIRGRFSEPRIHFALNCASKGCPRLPREPFKPEILEAQLERETRRFFAEERNLRIDHESRTVALSSILQWFESDFTDWLADHDHDAPATLAEYVARYVDEATADALRGPASGYAIEFVPYDWDLNDAGTSDSVADDGDR